MNNIIYEFYFKILVEEERRTRRKKGEKDKKEKEIIRTGEMQDKRDAGQEQFKGIMSECPHK